MRDDIVSELRPSFCILARESQGHTFSNSYDRTMTIKITSIHRFGMPHIALCVLLLAAFVFLLLAAFVWKPRVVNNDLPSKAFFSVIVRRAINCQSSTMAAELDGILELVKAYSGIPDPVCWIKTLECLLHGSYNSSTLDENVTQIWHSPRPAAEKVHMLVMVEWTMRKENRRFRLANLKGYFQKMVCQGEFYLIQADNESGLAKTILREVQNADSLRALYHEGIQVHTGPELERYLQQMLNERA